VVNASTTWGPPEGSLGRKMKGFALNKQVLLLSVALAAFAASPALADPDPVDDITTALTTPIATATANTDGTPADILLDTNGSITVTTAGAAVTINSNNSFESLAGTKISNDDTSNAVGILVDLTSGVPIDATNDGCTDNCAHTFEGITQAGAISLNGSGNTKTGLWLEGPDPDSELPVTQFIGNIDMTGSTMSITGDTSVGIKIDSLAELDGNLTLGEMTLKPSSNTSTLGDVGVDLEGAVYGDIDATSKINIQGNNKSSALLLGMDIVGTINGNLTFEKEGGLNISGAGATGIVLTGNINACDPNVSVGCTSIGSLVNYGQITTAGTLATITQQTGNPLGSFALAIGGNIAGGIYNAGPDAVDDITATASLSVEGAAPAVEISPFFETVDPHVPITIGVYTTELLDAGFSFYNRGSIATISPNYNDSTTAVLIGGGDADSPTTLTGGLFNSGSIQTSARNLSGALNAVKAVALEIASYGIIGDPLADSYTLTFNGFGSYSYTYNNMANKTNPDDWGALVNSAESGNGRIVATVSGAAGGEADALLIDEFADVPSIINQGLISAIATTTNTKDTTTLVARAIIDNSGTLTFLENSGTIAAATTTLDNGAQQAIAIDLRGDTESSNAGAGVVILDQATTESAAIINGDILFGKGMNQVVDVEGVSTDHTATIKGNIVYGDGSSPGSDQLIIGNYASVTGKITANELLGVDVDVRMGGTLNLLNDADSGALTAYDFKVESGGILNLTVLESFKDGMINALDTVSLDTGAKLNITYGSFVPTTTQYVLMTAPVSVDNSLFVPDIDIYNNELAADLPFLFQSATLSTTLSQDLTLNELVLTVVPKDASQLGLTGYAAQILPYANQALAVDDPLGAAFVNGITDQKTAQRAYNEMAPDVSGGARAIAIALTDQSSGPVAARQRMLRMYGKQEGEVTLWGEEFAEFVSDPGDRSTGQTGFKDHGFGFVLGLDGGDPKTGWYGGAFSFYSGDIVEPLPRDSHTNTLWYMLTGYTDWRGKGLFLDTKVDVGYMDLKSKRYISLTIPDPSGTGSTNFTDEADSHRPGLVGAAGFTTGAILAYGSTTITPQISVDGMSMREEGYTEHHVGSSTTGNGKGMDLQTQSYYASSMRAFVGTEVREDLDFDDFFVQPDIRIGYRYDFLNDPTKLKVNFADIGTLDKPTPGPQFTLIGPDPAQGNFVAGASIAATTDAWTLGANFDFVRGTNGATTEVGTIHLLGRI